MLPRLLACLASMRLLPAFSQSQITSPNDMAGRLAASGTYFYRLEAQGSNETKRMALVK